MIAASPASIEVSTTVLAQMFLYLSARQVDAAEFLRTLGLDAAILKSPDAYIPIETYLRIQDAAAGYTQDPCFGLHMGEYAEAGSWSILGYLMMNCDTIVEAFGKAGRYARIIGNLIEGHAHVWLKRVRIVFDTPPYAPRMSRHCYEATLASTVTMMRTLTGLPLNPIEVSFSAPRPADTGEYARVFACPVHFAQKENALTLDMALANTPIRLPNPALRQAFEEYAQKLLDEMARPQPVTRQVTGLILARLDDENLSIEKIAREMHVSVRTLQGRLSEEGTQFSDLLQEVRERLARQYLRENYSVETITYLLGFSEPSAFRKAFKKWAGLTPREYREMQAT